jgi:hypothetical protein
MSIWNNKVKRMLKSELVKRGISTEQLTHLLNEMGVEETKSSVDSKISRGTFSAAFFVQALFAIGCTKLEMEDFRPTIIKPLLLNSLAAEPNVAYKNQKDEEK